MSATGVPEVVRVQQEFRAKLAARESTEFEAMVRAWGQVRDRLEQAILDLAEEVSRQGAPPSIWQLSKMSRYQELLRQLQREMQGLGLDVAGMIEKEQWEHGRIGIAAAQESLRALGVQADFPVLPTRAVENMVGLAADGSPLQKLLTDSWPASAGKATDILVRNTALGVNPKKTARQMQDALGGTVDRMMRIARTEQLRVFRQASLDQYRASGLVRGYRRLCAKQPRTCAACLLDDGHFYTLDQVMPEHVCGRCTTVPSVVSIPDVQWETGREWLEKQGSDVQQHVLGKTRFNDWKAGKLKLEDIPGVRQNDKWGPSIVTRSAATIAAGVDLPTSVAQTVV